MKFKFKYKDNINVSKDIIQKIIMLQCQVL